LDLGFGLLVVGLDFIKISKSCIFSLCMWFSVHVISKVTKSSISLRSLLLSVTKVAKVAKLVFFFSLCTLYMIFLFNFNYSILLICDGQSYIILILFVGFFLFFWIKISKVLLLLVIFLMLHRLFLWKRSFFMILLNNLLRLCSRCNSLRDI